MLFRRNCLGHTEAKHETVFQTISDMLEHRYIHCMGRQCHNKILNCPVTLVSHDIRKETSHPCLSPGVPVCCSSVNNSLEWHTAMANSWPRLNSPKASMIICQQATLCFLAHCIQACLSWSQKKRSNGNSRLPNAIFYCTNHQAKRMWKLSGFDPLQLASYLDRLIPDLTWIIIQSMWKGSKAHKLRAPTNPIGSYTKNC